ncbi:MAG TPA: hypothetical protein VK211_11240 [Kamptonema sp.]|nr:hypothetical protein [Kamptonema sp.]
MPDFTNIDISPSIDSVPVNLNTVKLCYILKKLQLKSAIALPNADTRFNNNCEFSGYQQGEKPTAQCRHTIKKI